MRNKRRTRLISPAFTLVEMIIVIAIIGIFLTLATIAFLNGRRNARDVRRLDDVRQIQNALVMYNSSEHSYPPSLIPGQALTGSTSSTTYMAIIPSNPVPRNEGDCPDADYAYGRDEKGNYLINFCLAQAAGNLKAGPHCAMLSGTTDGYCLPVYDGLTAWFRGDQGIVNDEASSSSVKIWRDLSGQHNDLAQYTAADQPQLNIEAALNNQPAVDFDGIDDWLKTAQFTLSQPTTIFLAIINNYNSNEYLVDGLNNNDMAIGNLNGSSHPMAIYSSGGSGWCNTLNTDPSHPQIITAVFNGAGSGFKVNAAQNNSEATGSTAPNGLTLGSVGTHFAYYANIKVAEFLVYNRLLTDPEKQGVEQYLKNRYNINY